MSRLTPADYADTGQWRLLISIYEDGMTASLENMLLDDEQPVVLFESSWEKDDEKFLERIEENIYSHPRVLDDFATKIVVYDDKTLFVPNEVADEEEGFEENYYASIYSGEAEDIFLCREKGLTGLFCPGKGIKGFLTRTFPGAKITSHLIELVIENVRKGEGLRLIVNRRKKETDILVLEDRKLFCAATHFTADDTDALYHGFNSLDAYGFRPREAKIEWHGNEPTEEIKEIIRKIG